MTTNIKSKRNKQVSVQDVFELMTTKKFATWYNDQLVTHLKNGKDIAFEDEEKLVIMLSEML